jgi:hypothetical protein
VSSERLNSKALRVAVGKCAQEIFGALKFECCSLSARGDCVLTVVVRRVVCFAAVTELIFRCKTTKGVVEERFEDDVEEVIVSR